MRLTTDTIRSGQGDSDFGARPANYAVKLANIYDIPVNDISPSFSSSNLSKNSSKSKVIKKYSISLIKFCLKNGITRNTEILRFLKENEIVLKRRTFDRYKSLAEKQLENDLGGDIWLSEKVQNGLVHDYRDICDRYDSQLVLDDLLMDGLIKQAIDTAIQHDQDPDKYYRYLNSGEMMKIQAISNFTMKNKLELISKGFMVYRIKQHIDSLRDQLSQKELTRERDIDICSKLSFLHKLNPTPTPGTKEDHQVNNEPINEEYSQEYLEQNGLAIGMNGQPIKKYLADIEKKLGKPLSTL